MNARGLGSSDKPLSAPAALLGEGVSALHSYGNIAGTFVRLFSKPPILGLSAVLFALYWAVFFELIKYAGKGYFLVTVPLQLLVLFVVSSAILSTLSIAYLRTAARKSKGVVAAAQSPLTVAVGTVVVSCACELPFVAPLLYFLGMNSLGVSAVISSLAQVQEPLVIAMTALNAVSSLYYLGLIGAATVHLPRGSVATTAAQPQA